MKRVKITTGLLAAFCLTAATRAAAESAYADDYIETGDPAVRRVVTPTGVAYVFTNAAVGEVSVALRQAMVLRQALVVAGGGGGGAYASGGGGGGGVIVVAGPGELAAESQMTLSVGAGGAAGKNGGDSTLAYGTASHTAVGGGAGGYWGDPWHGFDGGSGGGGAAGSAGGSGVAGQGHSGGGWSESGLCAGGGGATQSGKPGSGSAGGDGGEGLASDITGVSVVYGSGGGGGGNRGAYYAGGRGGTNAGNGGSNSGVNATDGVAGTGGGGGGDGYTGASKAGGGGSGTVILSCVAPGQGIVTVASNADVPEGAISSGLGSAFAEDGAVFAASDWQDDAGFKGTCTGYALERYDEATGAWSAPVTNAATSFTYEQGTAAFQRVTWLWSVGMVDGAYADDFLATKAAAVKRFPIGNRVAYVFDDPETALTGVQFLRDVRIVRALVVAGGGGGGAYASGGGGGGGVISVESEVEIEAGTRMTLSVGAGGNGGKNGGDSTLNIGAKSHVAVGGGTGGCWGGWTGANGGSGGGSTGSWQTGGSGVAGQGHAGGSNSSTDAACGGGGAAEAGGAGSTTSGGKGGEGVVNDITGVTVVYGSGGGGGGTWGGFAGGKGGTNAGDGGSSGKVATSGVNGTGGGGGGDSFSGSVANPGKGGDGTVILLVEPTTCLLTVANAYALVPNTATDPQPGIRAGTPGRVCQANAFEDDATHMKGMCAGYVLTTYDADTGLWSEPVTNSAASFTVPAEPAAAMSVTWLWQLTFGAAAAYADNLIETMGLVPVRKRIRIDNDTRDYVYTFTTTGVAANVLLKADLNLSCALVVAGGGGGGSYSSGGGGGGGVIAIETPTRLAAASLVSLSVGAGGAGGKNGGDSTLAFGDVNYTAVGGGTGGYWGGDFTGRAGGSGGGGAASAAGGAGVSGQGNAGGGGGSTGQVCSGGGGATQVGKAGSGNVAGDGGEGLASDITGVSVVYGSGGGGGGNYGEYVNGKGGTNAGNGGNSSVNATDGVAGTGGGGGGDGFVNNVSHAGKGGSGTVILRFSVKESRTGMLMMLW